MKEELSSEVEPWKRRKQETVEGVLGETNGLTKLNILDRGV